MIILASASPRRQEMLQKTGLEFSVIPANIEEFCLDNESPQSMVKRLAAEKANAVAMDNPSHIVIAADTIVVIDGEILGKPVDLNDARKMIQQLNNKRHEVYTGISIYLKDEEKRVDWLAITEVIFNKLTQTDIEQYLSIAKPLDKAGAYAIQTHGDLLVKSWQGSYHNIVGLPMLELLEKLETTFSISIEQNKKDLWKTKDL